MNCQELQEELTVQEVILDSLQGETFEGVEQDRDEARAEISRLKRALTALSKAKKDEEGMEKEKHHFYLFFFFSLSLSPFSLSDCSRWLIGLEVLI